MNPRIADRKLLWASRLTSLVCGVLGVYLALKLESIISALTIFYSLMSVSLAAPLVFGLFSKRAGNSGAFLSAVSGIALTLYMTFSENHIWDLGFVKLNASTCGILLAFVVMCLSVIVLPAPSGSEQEI